MNKSDALLKICAMFGIPAKEIDVSMITGTAAGYVVYPTAHRTLSIFCADNGLECVTEQRGILFRPALAKAVS